MRRRWLVAGAILAGALWVLRGDGPARERVVTFNIEHFPRGGEAQIEGAFDEIEALGASIVAVQEITDRFAFFAAAQRRLGPTWEFVHDPPRVPDHHHVGVLFDRARWRAMSMRVHDGTVIGPLDLPVFEMRFADRDRVVTRVYVVHFRPKTIGRAVRAVQHAELARIVAAGRASGEHAIVLGDFNATEDADRDDLAALARAADLTWATEDLACTAFWSRPDGCARSRLDHVLTSRRPVDVQVAGACATHGCELEESCPLYRDRVSDHCPVAVSY